VCLDVYRSRREWDAAFDVIVRTQARNELEDLMRRALDDLLDTARLSTLERWCDLAADLDIDAPIFSLALAELMLRYGRHVEAMSRAESAAADPELEFRALSVAGRAAHLASREADALALYERAEAAASTDAQKRDARWGQLMCLIDLEVPTAEAMLLQLSEGVGFAEPRAMVQAAANRLYLQLRQGGLDLDEAEVAGQLLPAVGDPLVTSSFLSGYAIALGLAARYDDALNAAEELEFTAERYRLDFALNYSWCAAAIAHAGSRRWLESEQLAQQALERARRNRDLHAVLLSCSVLLRLYAQQGRVSDALGLEIGRMGGALDASVGEVVCSRALVMACGGRVAEALETLDGVRGITTAVEPTVLTPAVEAICAVRSGGADVIERANALEGAAFATGAVDILVTAYRSCPELLSILLRSTADRRFRELVARVGDSDLANAVGHPIAFEDRRLLLSPRERDVYNLLRSRLTNKQIASLLYIEESTVKAHAHRIYDKLGVRSRSALAVQALLEQAGQATSAIGSATDDSSPPL
jgi:DNA-binding NarL/FixJ family response regulator